MRTADPTTTDIIYNAIVEYAGAHHGATPTVRELAAMTPFHSTCTIRRHLIVLRALGAIDFQDGKHRSITIAKEVTDGEPS